MTVKIGIEDVFTIRPNAKRAPDGGHVALFRIDGNLPKAGAQLVQGEQTWPILAAERFRAGSPNIGILLPAHMPKPVKGEAQLKGWVSDDEFRGTHVTFKRDPRLETFVDDEGRVSHRLPGIGRFPGRQD
jgi:hypothetical protein